MAVLLNTELWFPPVDLADNDGLLAVGGDLRAERLILAYRNGIFPWYNHGDPILWWYMAPRFVLFPAELHVSKNLARLIRNSNFTVTYNTAFRDVICNCRFAERRGEGTWISEEIIQAYCALHDRGIAHSVEVWNDGELAGGLYGVKLGNIFFGESMFSKTSDASKFGFVAYVNKLLDEGVALIDCQVYTQYLESFGARFIPGTEFSELLKTHIPPDQVD